MSAVSRLLTLSVLGDRYGVLRFAPDAAVPEWATRGEFCSVTRTQDELSVVCRLDNAPANERATNDWRVLKVHGPFSFDETGVLASLAAPLAAEGVGIFVISTFDTDYLLVRSGQMQEAIAALEAEGHRIIERE